MTSVVNYQYLVYNIRSYLPYARHYNPLLIWNRSWLLTIHKVRILQKKLLKKRFWPSNMGWKSIQTAGYNGARTVITPLLCFKEGFFMSLCMVSIQERFVIKSYNESSTHMKENVQEANTEAERLT